VEWLKWYKHLLSKYEARSSNPGLTKKEKEKKIQQVNLKIDEIWTEIFPKNVDKWSINI
jgi:hypothetical protein